MNYLRYRLLTALVFSTALTLMGSQSDLLIADFEGATYGNWTATGTAFGSGPAQGTLPNQMTVTGFEGHGLVNSYYGGDQSQGKLVSPEFRIERKRIRFLIGGGGWAGKTCLNLVVNGRIVRTATGPNTQPGGSEALAPADWDVSEWSGQPAHLEVVDEATGGWGHINVDQIVQTDRKLPGMLANVTREIVLEKRYLSLPVRNGAPKRHVSVSIQGRVMREFEIELADTAPDWWAFLDLDTLRAESGLTGSTGHAVLRVDRLPEDSGALAAVDQTDQIKGHETLYSERLRPQFHFTSRRGWNNDPNGLVYYRGEYHLFYQHNPYGWNWGNMHWGHAVSRDLVHWQELPIALYPDAHGTMFSGSAVVDERNTSGFRTGKEAPLVCIFTAAGKPFTQGLAYSNDRGRTWKKYEHNPVLNHIAGENRDPKVIWYEPNHEWIMALYLDKDVFALFRSPDLKQWERLCDIPFPGTSECPEFFEMPVAGEPRTKAWVFYGGNGRYLVGKFDGRTFTPTSGPHPLNAGNCFYASQTYNQLPARDGRRILIPWGQMSTPSMPFNQMMGLPVELTLHPAEDGFRLRVNPVKELESLRASSKRLASQSLAPGQNPLAGSEGELLDVVAELSPNQADEIGFVLRGVQVSYDVKRQELSCANRKAALPINAGTIRLRLLVDRTSVDIFGNDGQLYMPMGIIVPPDNRTLSVYAKGGTAAIHGLRVHHLQSAWKNQ